MSRLIDADALKEHIDKLPALPDGNFAGNHSALKALINMQPTIEPERKNGKWIQDGHHIQCNQCGISICDKDREGNVLPKNFCSNCGSYNGGDENRENSHTV